MKNFELIELKITTGLGRIYELE